MRLGAASEGDCPMIYALENELIRGGTPVVSVVDVTVAPVTVPRRSSTPQPRLRCIRSGRRRRTDLAIYFGNP